MQRCILAILSLAFCAGAQAVSEDVQLNLVTTPVSYTHLTLPTINAV